METDISKSRPEPDILSISLGMVVIDEIHLSLRQTFIDVADGSGCFGMSVRSIMNVLVLKNFDEDQSF